MKIGDKIRPSDNWGSNSVLIELGEVRQIYKNDLEEVDEILILDVKRNKEMLVYPYEIELI